MNETARTACNFVPLGRQHLEGMRRIFNHHIATGYGAYPEESIDRQVVGSFLLRAEGYPAIAVEAPDGALLGFGFLSAYSVQAAFAHTAQITIFLDPQITRAGIGTRLLRRLETEAYDQGITAILAHISSRNPASLAFHAKHGFIECGRFPKIGRKWGKSFDVVWMIKPLGETA